MSIDRRQLLDAVRALDLPAGEYAVFGSGPLVVRELRTGQDIDLLVTAELYERMRADGWQVRDHDDGGETLTWGDFDVMRTLEFPAYRGDVPALIAGAELIDGVPFVSLDDLRTFKTAYGRPKDHVDVDLIDQAQLAERDRAPTAAQVAHARAVLADHDERRQPPTRSTSRWGAAYLVLLAAALLLCVSAPLHGRSAAWMLFAPVAAGIALGLAAIAGRLAYAVATRGSGDGDPAAVASRTGVVFGLCSLPDGVVTLFAGDGPARTYVWLVTVPVTLGLLGLLYARSLEVPYGRGVLAAVAGYAGAFAVLVLGGLLVILAGTLLALA